MLPILHLNGYKIANPTILARIPEDELVALFRGTAGSRCSSRARARAVHQAFAAALDRSLDRIAEIQRAARDDGETARQAWPMIVLRTPKGWTRPKEVDGLPTEGSWRSHQVPMTDVRENPAHLALLEDWLRSYRPRSCSTSTAGCIPISPSFRRGRRRMSANPHANGGELLRDLALPDFRDYAVEVDAPGNDDERGNARPRPVPEGRRRPQRENFRIFGPDETASNRLGDVFGVTNRVWNAEFEPTDDGLAPEGRVVEVLSEHLCQGWLEGYLLTGRHGLFNCYEAFIHIVDSMFNQHAKWLKVTRGIPGGGRSPRSTTCSARTSGARDHNGFSHQDPGFIDHVVNKKARSSASISPGREHAPVRRRPLPAQPDYVNVIVAGKQPR